MAFATALPAFAEGETQATTSSNTITIQNAAKGETYAVYQVLSATENGNGGIDYIGPIPDAFNDYLEPTTVGTSPNTYSAIGVKAGKTEQDLKTAAQNFVVAKEGAANIGDVIAAKTFSAATAKQTADGNSVIFDVAPGYYVVVSTQGTAVMVDSTTPNATIKEKNTKVITASKEADGESYSIGDTITYTATFDTTNYYAAADDADAQNAQIVKSYEITDTLPEFLTNVNVKSITVGGKAIDTQQFDDNKTITIEWATQANGVWTSKYANGSQIVVEYTAELTSIANINGANKNTISIQPVLGDDTKPDGSSEHWTASDEIFTYAAALKKTDGTNGLAGAEFQVAGLIAEETEEGSGIWVVKSYKSTNTPTTLTTDKNGKLYIVGLKQGLELRVTETKAPDGYNKLNETKTLSPKVLNHKVYYTEGTINYDADGNIVSQAVTGGSYEEALINLADLDGDALTVINNKGTELPSTGGIGTTIFYIVGGVMVAGAVVFLLTKRRVAAE